MEKVTFYAVMDGADKISESHLAKALSKIKQVSRPFVVKPFNESQFDLEAVFKSEMDAQNRYKEKLMIKRNKTRKSLKSQEIQLTVN